MNYRGMWERCVWVAGLMSLLSWTAWGAAPANSAKTAPDGIAVVEQDMHVDRPSVAAAYGKLPLSFEKNTGQTDSRVKYQAHGQGYGLFLTAKEAVLALHVSPCPKVSAASSVNRRPGRHESPCVSRDAAVRLQMSGANRNPKITGVAPLAGKSNYFVGSNPAKWHTNVPNFAEVKYENVYPGIDLVYYGNQRQLEFDLVVAPGADPGQVRFKLAGAKELTLNSDGDLVIHAGGGDVSLHKPVVYQTSTHGKDTIDGHYVLVGQHEVAFQVGSYDKSKTLVVDPTLVYSTFLGGSNEDQGKAIAVDASGNTYIGGNTASTDFPTKGSFATSGQMFVTKLNPTGTALVYSSYFGGNITGSALVATECGPWPCLSGLTLDSSGNVYITGVAFAGFPAVNQIAGACNTHCGTYGGTFVAKINAAGSAIDYASVIGGGLSSAIAVDSAGNAYVAGETFITSDFPIVNALQPTFGGGTNDAFLFKVNPTGSALVYSTFLGGNGVDQATGVAVDSSDNVYVAGSTFSSSAANTFPVLNQIPGACVGKCGTGPYQEDVFVTKVNAAGTALVYSSLLGGSGNDGAAATGQNLEGASLAIDSSGAAYVAGITVPPSGSNDFPTTPGAFQTQPIPCAGSVCATQGFVTKINPSGNALAYSTFFGNNNNQPTDVVTQDIAVDSSGDVAIVGTFGQNFPLVNPLYPNYILLEPSIAVLNPSGSALLFASNLTGSSGIGAAQDGAFGVTFESPGNVFVTGGGCSAIPVTTGAFQTTCNGAFNAYVAEISFAASAQTPSFSPTTLTYASQAVGTPSPSQTITLTNSGSAALSISGISITGTNGSDFSETTTCGSSVAAAANCTISVTFKPTAAGARTASVSIADNASGSPQTIALTGTGAAAAPVVSLAPPTGLTFASQTVGTASSGQNITLTNTGSASLSITAISITGTNSSDYSQTNTCTTVAPSAFCTISVTFKPTATGTRTASVSIADNATGSPQAVALTGTGATAAAPAVTLSPTGLTFASETIGSSSTPQSITLTNSGTAALSVTGITITGTNSGDFSETNTCGANVAASANCTISIAFKPTAAGTRTASVSIADNAAGSPQTVPLTGTGAGPAPDFSITASPASVTVTAGSSGPSTLTVTPSNGFNQAVSFACSGLPSLATCTFSPATVTPNGSAVTTTVTIATTASTTAGLNQMPAKGVPGSHMTMALAGLVACLFTLGGIKRQRYRWLSVLLILAGLGMLSGCGGSSKKTTQGTPPGTYTVSVTATSGTGNSALSHNATVSLTVQ